MSDDGRREVRDAAAELLERGQMSAREYADVVQGAGDDEYQQVVWRLGERLQRLPPSVVAATLAGVFVEAAGGDSLEASRQVLLLERLCAATVRRAGG